MTKLFIVFAILIAAGLAASWVVGSAMVKGEPSAVDPANPPARDITIKTQDGLSIAGTFHPGRGDHSAAVLLLHGVGASRAATEPNAAWLASLGYATLTIDFRGHGQSDMAARSFGLNEAMDARAAFNWLKRQQHDARVAVIGMSLGGAAALIGRDGPLPADALVLQAVYPDIRHAIRNRIATRLTVWPASFLEPLLSFQALPRLGVWPSRLSPREALGRYPGPVLVVDGTHDQYTPPAETRALFEAAKGERELWLAPVGDHSAMGDLADGQYRGRVEAFLGKTIGQPD